MMQSVLNRRLGVAAALCAAMLAGCEGLGDGDRPSRLFLAFPPTLFSAPVELDEPVDTGQCAVRVLGAFFEFEEGGIGSNAAERVTWSSSDESVLRVSNGDITVPGEVGGTLVRGALVPLSAGTATITATFSTLSASIDVNVIGLDSVEITPQDTITALGAARQYRLLGTDANGDEVDLTGSTEWSAQSASDGVALEEIARIGSISGTLVGQGEGALTVNGDLRFCDDLAESTSAAVETPQSVELRQEFPESNRLVVGSSEAFSLFGIFADGSEQDLTNLPLAADGQVITNTENPEQGVFGFGGVSRIFGALSAGDGTNEVFVTYDPTPPAPSDDGTIEVSSNAIRSETLVIELVEATPTALTLTPATAELEAGETATFVATATFDDGAFEQIVTRHVIFGLDDGNDDASDDGLLAVITNTPSDPGRFVAGAFDGQIDVVATCVVPAAGETPTAINVCQEAGATDPVVFEARATVTIDGQPLPDDSDDSGTGDSGGT